MCNQLQSLGAECKGEFMPGIDRFACITVAVKDQDEALRWFTEKLGFVKRVDRPGPGMRFLTVSPQKQPDLQVILASWFPDHIGKNPTAVLYTDDCPKTYDDLKRRGVEFTEPTAAETIWAAGSVQGFVRQQLRAASARRLLRLYAPGGCGTRLAGAATGGFQ